MAAAHVTGAGLLRASRDQAAPLPQAARGLRARRSGGRTGLTCGAPGPGAGGCEAQAAADSAGLFGHQTPGQNPAPGTRSPAQPAREAPRGGAGRGAARPTGFGVQVKAGAGPPESRSAPQG